jgi:hypothetical protein
MAAMSQIEVPRFSESGNENGKMFINACRLAFVLQEGLYPSKEDKDLAHVLMLTSKLVGKAAAYYNT